MKGRFAETKIDDDHQLTNDTYQVTRVVDGKFVDEEVPALSAINARLLDDYIADCQGGINRWNKIIQKANIDFEITQPHKAFNRRIGEFESVFVTVDGEIVSEQEWNAKKEEWLCSDADGDYIQSLMKPCTEIGKYANWIAEPRIGINNQAGDFEYVKID